MRCLIQQVLHAMDTELFASGAGKQHLIVTSWWFLQPGLQYRACGFGQGYTAFFPPLSDDS